MRESGVRGLFVHYSDYQGSHSIGSVPAKADDVRFFGSGGAPRITSRPRREWEPSSRYRVCLHNFGRAKQ
jgi:hypothetical protein